MDELHAEVARAKDRVRISTYVDVDRIGMEVLLNNGVSMA
jgi:hypothetical protein